MNTRSLLAVFCVASACLFIAAPALAQSSKKKPKEIVVVGSKVKDVVREAGTTHGASSTQPALDNLDSEDSASEQKKKKEGDASANANSSRSAKPVSARSTGARKPAKNKRPSGAKKKKAPETEED